MSEKLSERPNQPVYRAAAETAHLELRQIADRLNQLRVRHEQICIAVQALKLLVSPQDSATPASPANHLGTAGKPVHTMNSRAAQQVNEVVKVQALA